MKFLTVQQGSVEWLQARAGKITASRFADAISLCSRKSGKRGVGDPTAEAERYAADLSIERISTAPHGEPPKAWALDRGHEMEANARRLYEARTGAFVTESGICIDDDGRFAYSSDGLVDDDGLIEIKAPIDSTKILAMWQFGDTSEYDHQMQGGMWITGRKWCDFIMYVPDLACIGKNLYIKRVFRDEAFIDAMVERLAEFDKMVVGFVSVLRGPQDDVVDAEFIEPAPAAEGVTAFDASTTGDSAASIVERPLDVLMPAAAWPFPSDAKPAAAPTSAPTLRLGQIVERLGVGLTREFIETVLGVAPSGRDRAAVLYADADLIVICSALIHHIEGVCSELKGLPV